MDSAAKTQPPRAVDRVLEALSTLAALLDRTINEVKTLDSDYETRLAQAIRETEISLQTQAAERLETALSETRTKLEEQFGNTISELSAQWEEERARLHAELSKMTQTNIQWEAERARLNGEVERLARVQAATQAEAEKAIMAMKAASAKGSKGGASVNTEALTAEIQRVENLIREISAVIEDPAAELSTVIRKNVERAELESYLKGIRFALNGGSSS
jgi:exonuclease VII large subunit